MSALRPSILQSYSSKIVSENLLLISNAKKTFLTVDSASSLASLTVKNIIGFAINQVLIIGEFGNEGTELIKTSASVAPTGSTITLATSTVFPHSSGTPVYIIDYDQLEFSTATTLTGSKSVLSTGNIQVDSQITMYTDTANSTGFYFTRFKNTITSIFSPYSDGIPIGGYGILTSRSLIDNALGMLDKVPSETLSDYYGFQQINNCQMEVIRELKRWSFLQVFDYSLGQFTTGQWKTAVPTNLDDQFTNKAIYNFRIGSMPDLTWVDKEKWNEIIQGTAYTTLAVAISLGNATATLTDASDFPDSGSLYIGANIYAYTSVNRSTNIVTLSVVAATTNLINADVFSGATFGMPQYWTIFGGNLYWYPVLGSQYTQRDGHLDYYVAPTSIINDSDLAVLPDPTILHYYLAWKYALKQQSGREDETTKGFYSNYVLRREKLKQKEVLGRTFKLKPILNNLDENNVGDDKSVRLGNFPTS